MTVKKFGHEYQGSNEDIDARIAEQAVLQGNPVQQERLLVGGPGHGHVITIDECQMSAFIVTQIETPVDIANALSQRGIQHMAPPHQEHRYDEWVCRTFNHRIVVMAHSLECPCGSRWPLSNEETFDAFLGALLSGRLLPAGVHGDERKVPGDVFGPQGNSSGLGWLSETESGE